MCCAQSQKKNMWASKKLEIQVVCKNNKFVTKKKKSDKFMKKKKTDKDYFDIKAWNFERWNARLISIEVYK